MWAFLFYDYILLFLAKSFYVYIFKQTYQVYDINNELRKDCYLMITFSKGFTCIFISQSNGFQMIIYPIENVGLKLTLLFYSYIKFHFYAVLSYVLYTIQLIIYWLHVHVYYFAASFHLKWDTISWYNNVTPLN